MATLPLNISQAPTVNVPGGPPGGGGAPSFQGFLNSLTSVINTVAVKQSTNAHNRGVNKALEVWKGALPRIRDFRKRHEGDADFDQRFVEAVDQIVAEESGNVQVGDNERERTAFDNSLLKSVISEVGAGLTASSKRFVEENLAVMESNLTTLRSGASGLSAVRSEFEGQTVPSPLDAVAFELATVLREASSDDPDAPGIIGPGPARERFDDEIRGIQLDRLMMQNADNESLFLIAHDPEATIEVFTVDEDLNVVTDENGLPVRRNVPLTSEERTAIRDFAVKRGEQRKSVMTNTRLIQEERVSLQKTQILNHAIERINAGDTGVAADLSAFEIPEMGLVFSHHERITLQNYEDSQADRRARGTTTDRKLFMRLLDRASKGQLPLSSLSEDGVVDNISHEDTKLLASTNAAESRRKFDQGDRLYSRRKSAARDILKRFFGVHDVLLAGNEAANFLGDALLAFEERLNTKYQEAIDAGGSVADIDPLLEAQRLINERQGAFFDVLIPEGERQAKALSIYIDAASRLESPSLQTVMDTMEADYALGNIGPAERERQLFIINALRRRNVTFEQLQEIQATGTGISSLKQSSTSGEEPDDKRVTTRLREFGGTLLDRILDILTTTEDDKAKSIIGDE